MNRKVLLIASAIVALIVIGLFMFILIAKPFNKTDNGDTNAGGIKTPVNSNDTSILAKTWYSDRPDGDQLTMTKDGSYNGTVFLTSGTYKLKDGIVTCSSMWDGVVELKVVTVDGKTCLYHDNGYLSFYYHDTQAAAEKSMEARAADEARRQEAVANELSEILLGVWKSTVNISETTITFTDKEYTIYTPETEYLKASSRIYEYEIQETRVGISQHDIKMIRTDSDGRQSEIYVRIIIEEDRYLISLGPGGYYEKSKGDVSAVSPAPEEISTSTEDDKQSDEKTEKLKAINKSIEDDLIGTWEGTSDSINPNRVIHKYVFFDDGTYEYSKIIASGKAIEGFPYEETGTYTIAFASERESAGWNYSTLILTHEDTITEKPFYLTAGDKKTLNTNYGDDPTFVKK